MSAPLVPYLLIAVPGEVEGSTSDQSLGNLRGKLDSVGAGAGPGRGGVCPAAAG